MDICDGRTWSMDVMDICDVWMSWIYVIDGCEGYM